MTFIPLFPSIRSFLPHAVRSRCQCSRRPVLRVPYKDTTKRWKNKALRVKQACAQGCSFPLLPRAMASPGRKPSQSAPVGRVQIPPFVATRHLPPERGKSFLSGGAFRHLPVSRAKPPPSGEVASHSDDGEGSSVRRSLHTKNAPGGPCSSPGASYVRYALAHTTGIYSISIRFGFSGRAFVC